MDSKGSIIKNYSYRKVYATYESAVLIGIIKEYDKEKYFAIIEFKN